MDLLNSIKTISKWLVICLTLNLFFFSAHLTVSAQLAGQIVVNPSNPRWLYYNRDSNNDGKLDPFYWAGAGGPEGFLYLSSSEQDSIINALKSGGANAIYMHMVRSHGGDGGSSQNPFKNRDPQQGVDQTILNNWNTVLKKLEDNGITGLLFFYDDSSIPYSKSTFGSVEKQFVRDVVNTFEGRKNIIWSIAEEYGEGVDDSKVRAMAAEIRATDDNNHPISIHQGNGDNTMNFPDDANIDQFAQQSNGTSAKAVYDDVLEAFNHANGRFNVNMAENWNEGNNDHAAAIKSGNRTEVRRRNWATGMAGGYVMVIGAYENNIGAYPTSSMIADWGRQVDFFESTNFDEMVPKGDLKDGDTEYLLAKPGESYIAYASNLSGNIGIKNMTTGTYSFKWFDPTNGTTKTETKSVGSGTQSWSKPSGIGNEVVVYLTRTGTTQPSIVFPGSSWSVKSPSELGMDEAKLNQFVSNVGGTGVIVKNGYLVKSWGSGGHGEWASASKPVYTMLLFTAIEEGKLSGVNHKIGDVGWNMSSKDQNMTFTHLANQMSGYARAEPPGQAWAYNDTAINLYVKSLMDKVYSTSPTNAGAVSSLYTASNRFGPLQFQDGNLFMIKSGAPRVNMTPRDYARFGWLWLNKGNWDGQQLLPRSYFDNYMKVQVPANTPRTSGSSSDYLNIGSLGGDNDQNFDGPGVYGYTWWFNGTRPNGQRMWPDAPVDTFGAIGHGGPESIIIFPSLNMVVSARGNWGDYVSNSGMNTNLKLLKEAAGNVTTPPPTIQPSPTIIPAPSDLVENFTVSSSRTYTWSTMNSGVSMYSDRPYTFLNVPSEISGAHLLQTPNDDKFESSTAELLQFKAKQNLDVYVVYTNVNTSLESNWLNIANGWQGAGFTISSTLDGAEANRLAKFKRFATGDTVVLMGNGSTNGSSSMYNIIIKASQGACIQGDINNDGIVNISDYSLLSKNYLSFSPDPASADINQDNIVNLSDFSIMAANFLKSCP
jgi:CubicO group peptidase (beta-lactamase class C family)